MSSSHAAAVSAFIEGAPPGELADVINDIKALTIDQPHALPQAQAAFRKYHEDQFTVVKLPGSTKSALVSSHNSIENGRYYDHESKKSFTLDHETQKASDIEDYTPDTQHHESIVPSLSKAFAQHASEHYPTSTTAIIPTATHITLLLVANKYSPSNFWNGRLRTHYTYTPSSGTLTGTLKCDVHYYEDGNVRLTTNKKLDEVRIQGSTGGDVVKEIAKVERKWQEELNRGFTQLSEGSFKGLRRQLPVTRQKMEWEKVGGLRVGREIGGMKR